MGSKLVCNISIGNLDNKEREMKYYFVFTGVEIFEINNPAFNFMNLKY